MSKFTMQDAQLPPIMEEEEVEFDPAQNLMNCNGPVIEKLENQERAIVPFNPVNNPLFHIPSNVSVSLSPDLISGFKGKYPIPIWIFSNDSREFCLLKFSLIFCYGVLSAEKFLRSSYYCMKSDEDEDNKIECKAVVPWVPSQLQPTPSMEVLQAEAEGEFMEDEEMGTAAMEIEESSTSPAQGTSNGYGGGTWNEGFPQWQQQHCMIPQLPQNTSTPITWLQ